MTKHANVTASELRVRLSKLDTDAALAAMEKAEAKWREHLIADDQKGVAVAEAAWHEAKANHERMTAAREALSTALAEAETREKHAALDIRLTAMQAEGAQLQEMLTKDYVKHARALKALGQRLSDFAWQKQRLNIDLSNAGRCERIEYPEKATLAANDSTWIELTPLESLLLRLPYV